MADLYFFETVVRIHRAGEGAPYTGLKPAGLGHGPVIPVAELGIEGGSPDQLKTLLAQHVRDEVQRRFDHLMELKPAADLNVEHTCEYVEAMLGLEVWANNLYQAVLAPANAGHDGHQHDWAPVVPARRLQRAGTQHTRKIGMLTAAGACSPAAPTAGPDARS